MYRFLFLLAASLAVTGCDQTGPTSAEDFDVQPAVSLSTSALTFTAGQDPPATFTVRYQGLDAVPEPVAADGVEFALVDETGSAQSGTRTYAVRFTGAVPSASAVDAVATVRALSGGQEITKAVALTVHSPVSISTTFRRRLAVVEDYEGDAQSFTATGGTTATVRHRPSLAEQQRVPRAQSRRQRGGRGRVRPDRQRAGPGRLLVPAQAGRRGAQLHADGDVPQTGPAPTSGRSTSTSPWRPAATGGASRSRRPSCSPVSTQSTPAPAATGRSRA